LAWIRSGEDLYFEEIPEADQAKIQERRGFRHIDAMIRFRRVIDTCPACGDETVTYKAKSWFRGGWGGFVGP
jgi:hypothetical protein